MNEIETINQRPTRKATYRLKVGDATEEQSEEGTGARRDTAQDGQSAREGAGRKEKEGEDSQREEQSRTLMVTWKRRLHTEKERKATLPRRQQQRQQQRSASALHLS